MPAKDLEALVRRIVASVSIAGAPLLLTGCSGGPKGPCDDFKAPPPYIVILDAGVPLDASNCSLVCQTNAQCTPTTGDAGQAAVSCQAICTGRPPSGLVLESVQQKCAVGAYLARMGALEQASVASFERLGRELEAHGAPSSLVSEARRSALDERRHAKSIALLASAHGAVRVRFGSVCRFIRPLAEVALENATSGCVLETYGAAEAAWQVGHASDPSVRTTMASVAPDEARHAALAWKVDAWAQCRLTAAGRRKLAHARRATIEELASSHVSQLTGLGLPDAATKACLMGGLARWVWA